MGLRITRERATSVEVQAARPGDRPVLRRLMQLYLYDFAAIEDWDLGEGLYGDARRIEGFWRDPRRHSFLVRVDGKLAGFAILREEAHFAGEGTREISEFFVLRR
jgi:predicted acetyltransferase